MAREITRALTKVVEATLLEDLSASLEPHTALAKRYTVAGQELRGHNAKGAQQSPARMDDLDGAVAAESLQEKCKAWEPLVSSADVQTAPMK